MATCACIAQMAIPALFEFKQFCSFWEKAFYSYSHWISY
jgi:hypothetical protein